MIWNFPWYSLPVDLQKDFLFIMMNVAQSSEINLFYIGPLNLETFVTVSSTAIFCKNSMIQDFLNFSVDEGQLLISHDFDRIRKINKLSMNFAPY
jgi:hypothetical protein